MRRIDPIADIEASEYDRVWFENHPGETEYIRRSFPGEPFDTHFVRVVQIAPGLRVRHGVTIEILWGGGHAETSEPRAG